MLTENNPKKAGHKNSGAENKGRITFTVGVCISSSGLCPFPR